MNIVNTGIFGFDVSFYQDADETPQQIDFEKMREFGASFVIVRAGQNLYKDPDFDYNWRAAKDAGLGRGSYWFCDRRTSGRNQARIYWDAIKGDVGGGVHFVDYEKDLQGNFPAWQEVADFLTEFQSLSQLPDHKIGVYTGYYFWTEHGPTLEYQRDWFGQFPLWLSWYTANAEIVRVPFPWAKNLQQPVLWQDGTPAIGSQAGVESREIDHNIFNGDAVKFEQYFGTTPTVPPTGEKMYNCQVLDSATPYVNLRATPNGADIGDVYPGTTFTADRIELDTLGRAWLHSTKEGMIGYVASWVCTYEEFVDSRPVIKVKVECEGYQTVTVDMHPL